MRSRILGGLKVTSHQGSVGNQITDCWVDLGERYSQLHTSRVIHYPYLKTLNRNDPETSREASRLEESNVINDLDYNDPVWRGGASSRHYLRFKEGQGRWREVGDAYFI
jgi:hypothetical protein